VFERLYSILINILSYLGKLFGSIEINIRVFCDYTNDGFTTVLVDTKSIGFDRSCLEIMNCSRPWISLIQVDNSSLSKDKLCLSIDCVYDN
jgi:hypothetical protein